MALGREHRVEQSDQWRKSLKRIIETLSDVEQGCGITESGHHGFVGLLRLAEALDGGDEIVEFAEIDLADDLGNAIDALGIAGVVVGVAANLFRSETRHT